jgi:hypothetical protein
MGEERSILLRAGRKSVILLQGSEDSPARPSDNGRLEVKTLGWLEAVA